ncbi:hypothetical protein FBU30_009893 [Linnemannia zychae]|nr:hypothetical protein FBU30_009893 [Linnemannia zychae]
MMKQSGHYSSTPQSQKQQGHPNPSVQLRSHKQQHLQQSTHMGDHEPMHVPYARSHPIAPVPGGREAHAGLGSHHSQNMHEPSNGLHRTHNRGPSQSNINFEHHHHQHHGSVTHIEQGSSRISSSGTASGATQASRHSQPQHPSHSSSPRSTFSAAPPPPPNAAHGGVGPIRSHNPHHPHSYHPPTSSTSQSQNSHSRTHSHSHLHSHPPSHSHRHTSSSSGPYPHPSQRHNYPFNSISAGTGPNIEQRYPHPDSYNSHRGTTHKNEPYFHTPAPSGRRSSQSIHPQGSATAGPVQSSVSQSMAADEDEDDEEDDGEIKQETRGRRRSNSLTTGSTQDGSNKKQAQEGDQTDVHKCMDCGKIYKHPNCLWKHRWLHSQYWKSATKFLLSKHQQVQLMEAAAILLGMDESRQGDNDPIVSMFSKQRGAMANSVGSGASSSSASPPTSTKSLSGSPPPQPERLQRISTASTSRNMEVQHTDIQMLTALRGGHASLKAFSTSFPVTPSTTSSSANGMTTNTPPVNLTSNTTKTLASSSQSSSLSSSPNQLKPTSALPSTASSSSRSSPPTLTADDESVPEVEEEMTIVTPHSRGGSTPIIPVVRVIEKLGGTSVGVVGMGIDMDVDPPKDLQQESVTKPFSKQTQSQSQQQQQQLLSHDYREDEDQYRYSGYQYSQHHHSQPPTFHPHPHPHPHPSPSQGPVRSYGGSGNQAHPQNDQQQQYRS